MKSDAVKDWSKKIFIKRGQNVFLVMHDNFISHAVNLIKSDFNNMVGMFYRLHHIGLNWLFQIIMYLGLSKGYLFGQRF